MSSKDQDQDPCEHILLQIISFHEKDFCVSYKCKKCKEEDTIRNIPYTKLEGRFGVLVVDEKHREPLELDFKKFPELQMSKN